MRKRRTPFANDPMMQRLHAVRREIDQELMRLDAKEWADYLNRRAMAAAEAPGYRLVLIGKGRYRLEEKHDILQMDSASAESLSEGDKGDDGTSTPPGI